MADHMTENVKRRVQVLQNHLHEIQPQEGILMESSLCAAKINQEKEDMKEFISIFQNVAAELIRELPSLEMPAKHRNWIKHMILETIPGGKMNRGMTVMHSFQLLVDRKLTRTEIFRAQILGWCVEMLQAFLLIADDIMDSSITRRGKPCWYKTPHPMNSNEQLGHIAINDSFLVESMIYRILLKYFRNEKYYADLLNLFHEVTYKTELGQYLDLTSNLPGGKVDLSLFTLETYKLIVKYKTAFYSFYLPVGLAMLLAGITSTPSFQTAEDILIPMGEYFQIQDDYLDCYGDPQTIGKIGRDIEDNKCSWLIVQALKNATAKQRSVLENHYGKDNPSDVAKVKQVYNEINMQKLFKEYEEESYKQLCEQIETVKSMPREVFTDLLAKIYKRNM